MKCHHCKGKGIDPKSRHRYTTGGHDDRSCPVCHGTCEELEERPEKQAHGDTFEDDGISFNIEESEGQRLWVRVGQVFYDAKAGKPGFTKDGAHEEYGIWLNIMGPSDDKEMYDHLLLISKDTFEALVKHVRRRFRRRRGRS